MNFKQKLAYMAIGCVFTLAGYFLATLGAGGFNPQNATAQDNTKQVIDEIVCRKIRVVNADGRTIAVLEASAMSQDMSAFTLYYYLKKGDRFPTYKLRQTPLSIRFEERKPLDRSKRETSIGVGMLDIVGFENALRLSEDSITIFKDRTNVLQAGIHNKGGGMIITRDKLGDETGSLPR